MPEKETLERAKEDKREGKAPSTQAGEFVREEIEHIRHGKHGARSTKQAIAIGLQKARRAGGKPPPPAQGTPAGRTPEAAPHPIGGGRAPKKAPARRGATSILVVSCIAVAVPAASIAVDVHSMRLAMRAQRSDLAIRIVRQEEWWQLEYAQDGISVTTANELHVPAGTAVSLSWS